MADKKLKICFICSSGGHYTELKRLKSLAVDCDGFLVTEKTDKPSNDFLFKSYYLKPINRREAFFAFKFLGLFIKEFFIFLKERPSCVISTGALCAFPMIRIAKFFGKKVVFVESFARVDDLSLTGKKVYKSADLFLVQWRELAEKYPKAEYVGSLFGDFE